MAFSYDGLKQAIQDYTENSEATFVNNLDIFIRAAEERILKNVQLDLFRRNAVGVLTASNEFLNCPSDFLAPYSLTVEDSDGNKHFLEFKEVSFIETYNPDNSTTGFPKYYAQYDVSNFIMAPTPDAAYNAEVQYLYRPGSLTAVASGSDTTWLSENGELCMLYGSLIEAYLFMKGESDVMSMYNNRFEEALIGLKMLGEAKSTTQEYRVGKVIRSKT